jgi:hypothetical protein
MKRYLVLSLLFLSVCCHSQSIILKVLGQHSYSTESQAYGAIIILEENPNKCDPIKGVVSIEEQLKHLNESIKAKGSDARLEQIKDYTYSEFRQEKYRIEESNSEIFNDIITACNNQQAIVSKTYFNLPIHDFEEEDKKAVAALNEAREKADILSSHINHKVSRILSVDDDTRDFVGGIEMSGYDKKKREMIMELLMKLSNLNPPSKESSAPNRKGQYNLWVTFEIVPL